MTISKTEKNASLSYIPRFSQPKNQVPMSKGVLCSPPTTHTYRHTDTKVKSEDSLSGFQVCLYLLYIGLICTDRCKYTNQTLPNWTAKLLRQTNKHSLMWQRRLAPVGYRSLVKCLSCPRHRQTENLYSQLYRSSLAPASLVIPEIGFPLQLCVIFDFFFFCA